MADESQLEKEWFEAQLQTPLRQVARVMSLIRQLMPELTEASRAKANEAIRLLGVLSNGEIDVSEHRIMFVENRLYPKGDPRQGAIRLMYENYAWPQEEIYRTLNPKVLATWEACRFADYILNRQDELAETTKRVEAEEAERDRAWKEHQAKQPPKAELGI